MNKNEALAWLKGERSMATSNIIPAEPHDTWHIRIFHADAAKAQQAYWTLKAHQEGLLEDQS